MSRRLTFTSSPVGDRTRNLTAGAEVAAITHGYEMGYIPAATLAHIIRRVAYEYVPIKESVRTALDTTRRMFKVAKRFSEYLELMHKAVSLSEEDIDDLDAIHALGQG